jgi:hypothetical protein
LELAGGDLGCAKILKNGKFVELPGGPRGVLWTHAEQVNSQLVRFLA